MPVVKVAATVRFNAYTIVERAVDEGVVYGLNQAHKHNDRPSREVMLGQIINAVMAELSDVINFGGGEPCGL